MPFAVSLGLAVCKAAAPQTATAICGYCWSCIAPLLPYATQAGSLVGGVLAVSKHIDESEARNSEMTFETNRFKEKLENVNSMELPTDEKLRVASIEQQMLMSEAYLKGHSMLASTQFRFLAHMKQMSHMTVDLQEMIHVATERKIDSHVPKANVNELAPQVVDSKDCEEIACPDIILSSISGVDVLRRAGRRT
jgi:hypothetical protein